MDKRVIFAVAGSGKTTLLNIVGGLDHYDSGNLIIDGICGRRLSDVLALSRTGSG